MGEKSEYKLQRLLGQGTFGKVFLAVDIKTDRLVAFKLIHVRSLHEQASVEREIHILQAVRECPNTLKIIDWSPSHILRDMHIVTEYYDGGTLKDVMERSCRPECSIPTVLNVLQDLATALACMHDAGYVHMDLKPDNVLVSHSPRTAGASPATGAPVAAAAEGSSPPPSPRVFSREGEDVQVIDL